MNYHGKLYGRIGGNYFDTGKTTDDWGDLENKAAHSEKTIAAAVLAERRRVWLGIQTKIANAKPYPNTTIYSIGLLDGMREIREALFSDGEPKP